MILWIKTDDDIIQLISSCLVVNTMKCQMQKNKNTRLSHVPFHNLYINSMLQKELPYSLCPVLLLDSDSFLYIYTFKM